MRKYIAVILSLSLVLSIGLSHAEPLYVIADRLNGRAEPSMDAIVEAHFEFGDELVVVSRSDKWIEVMGGETGTVFVAKEYTTDIMPVEVTETAYKVVSNAKVNVRATPGGKAVKRLNNGDKVGVSYLVGEWARIPCGWIKTEYLEAMEDD